MLPATYDGNGIITLQISIESFPLSRRVVASNATIDDIRSIRGGTIS